MNQATVTVTQTTPVTHMVVVVDKRGDVESFRRSVDGAWERWSEQHARWESFRYPLAEALLDQVAGTI